ncbi:MAG: HYR domain-containing protein [Chitinophagales bacterium]|nr:HYR domain-containing protein [Chitinophagales bacterium]
MKSVRFLFILIGLILSFSSEMMSQGCDPQLTSVNILNRETYCLTNTGDEVELEIHWTMGGGNPACEAPANSWGMSIAMPLNHVYGVTGITDVTQTGPFTWTYDSGSNTLRAKNNVSIPITSSGVIKVKITGNGSLNTNCSTLESILNIEIIGLAFGGSPGSFDNIIGNDVGDFDLKVREQMDITPGTIAACYPDVATAEAAALAATVATTTCMGTIVKAVTTTGDCSATITVTVTNDCGDVQVVTYNTRIDNTVPVFTPIANAVKSMDAGQCTYTVAGTEFDALATDNCPGAITYSYVLTGSTTGTGASLAGVPLNGGVTTVTWTAVDGCGNSTTTSFDVTVNDTEIPVITMCPADVTIGILDNVDAYATGMALAADNCTGVIVTYTENRTNISNSGCHAVGTIIRSFIATDVAGNVSAVCTQNITIEDKEAPIMTPCPTNIVIDTDPNKCTAEVTYSMPTSIDVGYYQGFEHADYQSGASLDWNNYGSTLVGAASGTNGVTSKTGTRHAEIIAGAGVGAGVFTRLGGYSSVFGLGYRTSVDVYIDLTNPAIAANTYGFDVTTASSKQDATHRRDFIFHVSAIDGDLFVNGSNNSNHSKRNDLKGLGDSYQLTTSGWYTFEWIFRDNGGQLAVDLNLLNSVGTQVWTKTRTDASDLIATVIGGNNYMWFTFVSPEGNALPIDNTTIERSMPVTSSMPSGSDFPLGTTTVTLTATDNCGNTSTCTFDVTVEDNENPVITTCAPDQDVNLDAGCEITVPDLVAQTTATDNCSVTVTQSPTAGSKIATTHNQTHVVTITATDGAGNAVTCTTTLTAKDVTNPVLTCASDQDVNLDAGCQITVPDLTGLASATDNCTIVNITQSPAAGDVLASAHNQTHGVTITATDAAGNITTCTTTLTAKDVTAPTVQSIPSTGAQVAGYTCGGSATVDSDPGLCSASVSVVKPIWTDNCTVASSTAAANNGVVLSDVGTFVSGIFPKGTTTVTFTGTDAGGNYTTCTVDIVVEDNEAPTLTGCPIDITIAAPVNACDVNVSWVAPIFTDNCSGMTVVQTSSPTTGLTNGSNFPIGVTTITYTATDASGNETTCIFTITVTGTCANVTEFTTTFAIDAANFDLDPLSLNHSRDALYTIDNIGPNPNNTSIQISLTKPSNIFFTTALPSVNFTVDVFGGVTANNGDWTCIDLPSVYLCTSKPGVVINPNSSSIIGLNFTANGSGASSNSQGQTVGTIVTGTAGDQNIQNNKAQAVLIIN